MAYDLYPAVDPSYNFPPEVRAALAASTELRNTVVPMTTTLRNNLTAGEKWDGRLILNTTTDRLERWDAGLAGWQQIADILDLAPYTAALLQRPGRNRIINGDFAVNQRSFTSTTTSSTYGLDRWILSASNGTVTYSSQYLFSPITAELPESARAFARIVTTGQTLSTALGILGQPIESVRTLSGKTVTVSFWAKAGSGTPKVAVEFEQYFGTTGSPSSAVDTYAGQVTLSTSWARYSVTVTIPSIMGKTLGSSITDTLTLFLWTSAGSSFNARTGSLGIQSATIDFWGVQVEEGSTATPFEVESYGDNLRKCQRYYWRQPNATADFVFSRIMGVAVAADQARLSVQFPTIMRALPTLDSAAATNFKVTTGAWGVGGSATGMVITVAYGSADGVILHLTGMTGLTAGQVAMLYTAAAVGAGYIGFSAEL